MVERDPSAEDAALACVRRVVEVDNARDAAGYRALLHDDYRAEVNGNVAATNADDEVASLEATWAGFSDGRTEPVEMWASGGRVTLRYRLVGTNDGPLRGQPPSGRKVDVEACTILDVEAGRVKRVWRYIDVLTLLGQLGRTPEPPR